MGSLSLRDLDPSKEIHKGEQVFPEHSNPLIPLVVGCSHLWLLQRTSGHKSQGHRVNPVEAERGANEGNLPTNGCPLSAGCTMVGS